MTFSLDAGGESVWGRTEVLLDAEDVAAMLGMKKSWVYARSRANEIPTVKLGPRYYRYRRDAIADWIVAQEVGAPGRPSDGVTSHRHAEAPRPLNRGASGKRSGGAGTPRSPASGG